MQNTTRPLADIMRPNTIDEVVGQQNLLGENGIIRRMVENNKLSNLILWGPPGCGKTTIARALANSVDMEFIPLSAVFSGTADIKKTMEVAKTNAALGRGTLLFIDEIHRFNKTQQDTLLPYLEDGTVVFIGATTENPSFEVITPLLSRCQVYVLKSLGVKDLDKLLTRSLAEDPVLKTRNIEVLEKDALFRYSSGDARKLLNILEIITSDTSEGEKLVITDKLVAERLQENIAIYDKNGEQHYDIISAFIKSMRGSDPNGAIYWMARMLDGGEDPLFIARRMLILASEDVGLANPNALLLAQATFETVHKIGMPEARIPLAECAIYLATSPKSNSAYMAINEALAMVHNGDNSPVPLHLRNAPTSLMEELGYAKDYKYAHSYEGNFVDQEFLPDGKSGTKFYEPGDNAKEREIRARLQKNWKKYGY